MNKLYYILIICLILVLCSCKDDCAKADKLRLQNKFEEAFELYQKAAKQGNAYAKWRLSKAYNNGDGVELDDHHAVELLLEAADEGCEEAKCDLALAYIFDWFHDINKDDVKGKKLIDDLAQKTENAYVLSRYASLFFFGDKPFEEDKEKAMSILKKVKDKKDAFYLYMMGDVYLNGTDNIEINEKKAIEYYSDAFEKGIRASARKIFSLYYDGKGNVNIDRKKAIEWANRGIESNNTNCMGVMANLYLNLKEDTTLKDIQHPQKGLELLRKAAKHGNSDAYCLLGQLYFIGKLVDKDDKKAFEYLTKSAYFKSPHGTFLLGSYYINGIGCEKDISKGIEIWKKAVEFGHGGAANNLYCYYCGQYGGPKVKDKAKAYLIKAAELGSDVGCFNIGKEYYYGNDLMSKNDDQAYIYIKKAADSGLVDACGWLSYFYDKGIGCKKDPQKAKEYGDKTFVNLEKNK